MFWSKLLTEHDVQYMKGLSLVDPDEVRTIFLVLFMIFEPLRLTAGYYGNLKEQVQHTLQNMLCETYSSGHALELRCRCHC